MSERNKLLKKYITYLEKNAYEWQRFLFIKSKELYL